jgi:hypothetical protein
MKPGDTVVVIIERIEVVRIEAVAGAGHQGGAAAVDRRARHAACVEGDAVGEAVGGIDRAQRVLLDAGIGAVAVEADRRQRVGDAVLLVARIDGVGDDLGAVARLPLGGQGRSKPLVIEILAVDRRQRRDDRRRRDQRVGGGIGAEGRAGAGAGRLGEAEDRRRLPVMLRVAIGIFERADVAAVGIDLLALLLVGDRAEDSESIADPLREQAGQARVPAASILAIFGLRAEREAVGLEVERPPRRQVDDRSQGAFVIGRRGRLGDGDVAEQLGREGVEVEPARPVGAGVGRIAAGDRERVGAVEAGGLEIAAEAANRDRAAFAIVAVDRDSGQALDRFGEVGVREVGNVLGGDRIDDLVRAALLAQRVLERGAEAGDDDVLAGRFLLGRIGRGGAVRHRLLSGGRVVGRLIRWGGSRNRGRGRRPGRGGCGRDQAGEDESPGGCSADERSFDSESQSNLRLLSRRSSGRQSCELDTGVIREQGRNQPKPERLLRRCARLLVDGPRRGYVTGVNGLMPHNRVIRKRQPSDGMEALDKPCSAGKP